jgi:3-oxoacyl-[acyl-carrier-protein] synthase II
MTAAICGIGVVGGFGRGMIALERTLSGSPVDPTVVPVPTREGIIQVPCLKAETAYLADFIPTRQMRRMSHYIRLGLLAAFDAMADAKMLEPDHTGRLGIIVATGHGATGNNYAFQYPFEDQEEICGSPTRFSNSVHNAAAAYISIALKAMGPNHSITHEDLSFSSALLTAMAWIRQRRVDAVLVGGVDELSHAHAYAWYVHQQRQRQTGAPGGRAIPLAGEGACFFVLKANDAQATAYARIKAVQAGRHRGGPCDEPPTAPYYILGTGGVAATCADYGPWVAAGARCASFASVYGDLPVDSAFDTAIAALSCRDKVMFNDDRLDPSAKTLEPLTDRRIACLKLGVGHTYGWTLVEAWDHHRDPVFVTP